MTEEVKKSKSTWIWLVLLFALGLVAGKLPDLLSNRFVLKQVLQRVNAASEVQVEAHAMHLRWQGVQELKGLTVTLPDGTRIEASTLEVRRRLIPALREKDLGHVEIIDPLIFLPEAMAAAPKKPIPPSPGPSPAGAPPVAPAEVPKGTRVKPVPHTADVTTRLPAMPEWKAIIQAESGRLFVGKKEVLSNWDARLDLNPGQAAATLSFVGETAASMGKMVAIGVLTADPAGTASIDQLPLELTLTLKDVEALELYPIIQRWVSLDTYTGTINSQADIKGSLRGGLEIGAGLELKHFQLAGPLTQGDMINLPLFKAECIARVDMEERVIQQLSFVEGPVLGSLNGAMEQGALRNLNTKLQIDLASITGMLPKTLRLREGLDLEKGWAQLELKLNSEKGLLKAEGAAKLHDLGGYLQEKPLHLNYEVGAAVKATVGDGQFKVERCLVRAPFITITGKGNLDKFFFNLQTDLGKFSKELGAFVDLKGWQAEGKLVLNATGGGDLTDPDRLEADAQFTQLAIRNEERVILPSENGLIRFNARPVIGDQGGLEKLAKPYVQYSVAGASGVLEADELLWSDFLAGKIAGINWSGQVDLASFTQVLASMGIAPVPGTLFGIVGHESMFSRVGSRLNLDSVKLNAHELGWIHDPRHLTQSAVRVEIDQLSLPLDGGPLHSMEIDVLLDSGRIFLPNGFEALSVSNVMASLETAVELDLDIARLRPALVSLGVMPTNHPLIAGRLNGQLEKRTDQGYRADLTLQQGRILQKGKEQALAPSYRVSGTLRPGEQVWRLPDLSLESGSINLHATGVVKNPEAERLVLMQGTLAYDLAKLAESFPVLDAQEVVLAGKTERPFRLKIPLGATNAVDRFRGLDLAAELLADEIQAYGFVFSQLEVPLQVQAGMGQANLRAQAGDGSVSLMPRLDATVMPPMLSLDTSAPVWTNVVLTPELADRVLSRIHPIFKGSAILEGSTTMILDEYSMPLDDTWQTTTEFSGRLLLDNVKLASSGLLRDVLAVVKLEADELDLDGRVIAFQCRNGRVTSAPAVFTVKDYELTLEGNLGLDQSLDYVLSTPITRELVGKEIASYAEDAQVKIPIGGTLKRPRIDSSAVKDIARDVGTSAVKDLLEDQIGDFLKGEDVEDRLRRLFQ